TSARLQVGQTTQLTATPQDAGGNPLAGRAITWSSGNASVATVSQSGLVTANAAGSATITATSEGKSGSAAITVTAAAPAPVATVTVSLASSSVTVGGTDQATAILKDASGSTLSGRTVTWSSGTNSVATVNSSTGLVTGVAAGTAAITATSEGKSGSATITVSAPTTSGSVVLVGAGDISGTSTEGEPTAKLLDAVVAANPTATVFTAGDNAYQNG